MPKDWWPDLVIVRGQCTKGEEELCVSVAMSPEDARESHIWEARLADMRFALWQAKHLDRVE
jgi:hypothetical protein